MSAPRRVLDVGALPTHAFGHRDPLWWAIALLVCIEGTMLVLLTISYFYLRDRMTPWPTDPLPPRLGWMCLAELGLWIASCFPMHLAARAARAGSLRGMRTGLILATIPTLVSVVLRYLLMRALPFRWDGNAYGSVVWTLLGTQWLHQLTSVGENFLYIALFFKGPVEDKHRVDVEVSTPLWYFTVAGVALVFAVIFLEPMLEGVL